ncbi:MAG TPA: 50S ribosomal protein L25 [Opitutales bacterium]|nr:50S ribosomal protein L25 [Opitutales bacterium]
MKLLKLPVHSRDKSGRGPSRRLRASGQIPAVVYGKSGVRHLTVKEPEFRMLMRAVAGTAALVEISDQTGTATLSLLQEVQRDARTDHFVHIDLREVSANEPMRANVPVRIIGESIGVKLESGIVEVSRHEVQIKCLPKDLPDLVFVDVTELHAGQSIHIRDLKAIPGVTFTEHADEVVAACVVPTVEEEPVAAEAAVGDAAAATAEGAAAPAEGDAAKAGDAKAAPAAGAKGAAPAAGAKGAAPAAGAKGAAPAAPAKGAAPAAKPAGKK